MFDEEPWLEHTVTENVTDVDESGPYIVSTIVRVVERMHWNGKYDQDEKCACGHAYYRHFDTYENMFPVGCKYCVCRTYTPVR